MNKRAPLECAFLGCRYYSINLRVNGFICVAPRNAILDAKDPETGIKDDGVVPNSDSEEKRRMNRKKKNRKGPKTSSGLRQRVENLWLDLEMPFTIKMSFAARYRNHGGRVYE